MFDGSSNGRTPNAFFNLILASFFAICAIVNYKNAHYESSIALCLLATSEALFAIGKKDQAVQAGEVPPCTVTGLIVGIIGATTLIISIFA